MMRRSSRLCLHTGKTVSSLRAGDCEGAWKGSKEATKLVTVTTKYPEKINDVCKAYIDTFNQDAVGLRVSEPMRFVTKVSEVF